jgi:hypothetical protein
MTKDELITYVSENGRICPNPQQWMALCEIIGANRPGHSMVPLILAGWAYSSDTEKNARLIEQIEYAFTLKPEVVNRFSEYLVSLKPEQWYCNN